MQQTYADGLRGIGRYTPLGYGAIRARLSRMGLARGNARESVHGLWIASQTQRNHFTRRSIRPSP